MYLHLKMLLLQQHSLGCPRVAFRVTKALIKATTRVDTSLSTKSTKVVIRGSIKAMEKDTKVAVNRVTMAQRVIAVNQLQIIVKYYWQT